MVVNVRCGGGLKDGGVRFSDGNGGFEIFAGRGEASELACGIEGLRWGIGMGISMA